jgi:arylamine N-acetyltransferase
MTTAGEWGIDAVDLDAYLARIGLPAAPPSAQALKDLVRAHVQAIPFENVDVVLQQHQGISLDVVSAKLVGRRRGGYCYEQSGLFAAVLERLGYTVHRLAARVQPRRPGPCTHLTLGMHPIDFEVYHHYTSTHPKSPFTGRLVIMTLEPGVSRKLLGSELTVEKPQGSSETTTVTPDQLDATLKDLGIELTPDELERLKAVY